MTNDGSQHQAESQVQLDPLAQPEPRDQPSRAGGSSRDGRGWRAVVRWVGIAEQLAGALLLSVILVLVLLQVSQRFLPGGGWAWTGELARYSLVWLTFAVCAHLMRHDDHITLRIIDHVAKGRALRAVKVIANLMVALICVGFANEAAILVISPSEQATPALGIPLTAVYVIPLIGFVLTAASCLLNAFIDGRAPAAATPAQVAAETAERRPVG